MHALSLFPTTKTVSFRKIICTHNRVGAIALIGTGGIGKTSFTLTVLHHKRMGRRFADNRRSLDAMKPWFADMQKDSEVHVFGRLFPPGTTNDGQRWDDGNRDKGKGT